MSENIDIVELLVFHFIVLYAVMSIHDIVKSYMLMMRADSKGFKTPMHKFFVEMNTASLIVSWLGAIVISGVLIMYNSFL